MRRLPILIVLVGVSCTPASSGSTTTTIDPVLRSAAVEYAASADRAFDGTRFEELAVDEVADGVIAICTGSDPVEEAIEVAVREIDGVRPDGDQGLLREVLATGVGQVCPARSGDGPGVDSYMSALHGSLGTEFDDSALIAAGFAVCDVLDAGSPPEGAVLAVVAELFDVEASIDRLDEFVEGPTGVVVGATVAAATAHLCPHHEPAVTEWVASR